MRRDVVVAVVAVVALLIVAASTGQKQTLFGATRASGDYAPGGYRGWYELLAREGMTVRRFRRHHDALGASGIDTLIVAFPTGQVPAEWNTGERDGLHAWVRNGGHLVDIGTTPSAGKDDLKGERVMLDDSSHAVPGALRGPWSAQVTAWSKRGSERIKPLKGAHVAALLGDRRGSLVVRYRYGRGSVLGIADASVFENAALGRIDDARLAYLAGQPSKPGGVVAFDEAVRGDIIERAWYDALDGPELAGLGVAAVAALLWLLSGIVQFGPAVRLTPAREPTSEEFIDAVAALYGRARARDHARDALVAAARRALERAPRTPENSDLSKQVDALAVEPVPDDAALIAVAQLARTARETTIVMTSRHVPRRIVRGAAVAPAPGAA